MSSDKPIDLVILDPEYGPIDIGRIEKLLEKSGVKRANVTRKDGYTCIHPIEYDRVDVQEGSDPSEQTRDNPFRIVD